MQIVLVMFRSDGERRSFSLARDMTVIGRREDCDLRLPLGDVSRKHCRIIRDGDDVRIEDLGSSNGTYHNGVRVQEAFMQPGDTVQIGPVAFVVQIDGVPADEDIQPATSDETAVGQSSMHEDGDAPVTDEANFAAVEALDGGVVEAEPVEAASASSDEPVDAEELAEVEALPDDATLDEPLAEVEGVEEITEVEVLNESGAATEEPTEANADGFDFIIEDDASESSLGDSVQIDIDLQESRGPK